MEDVNQADSQAALRFWGRTIGTGIGLGFAIMLACMVLTAFRLNSIEGDGEVTFGIGPIVVFRAMRTGTVSELEPGFGLVLSYVAAVAVIVLLSLFLRSKARRSRELS